MAQGILAQFRGGIARRPARAMLCGPRIPTLGAALALLPRIRSALPAPSLDPRTYAEPLDGEYWGTGSGDERPFAEERLRTSDLDQASFSRRIADGKVFVVEDVGRDWPMAKWDCDYFRSDPTFQGAEMTQQYAAQGGSGFVGFQSGWEAAKSPSGAKDKDAPQFAPYYWGIKDVQYRDAHRSKTWKQAMLKKVQEHVKLPAFMDASNREEFETTPEFWFAAAGAGAKAHMDTHVQATISLQLAGTKRWRLGMMEPRRAPFLAMIYKDGDVYEEATPWQPHFNVTLRPGEALFFPPGFIHETLNADGETCAASVTFQFSAPMATRLYRRFLPRVRRTADIHESWPLLKGWASLGGRAPKEGQGYAEAKAEALGGRGVGKRFANVDKDGNGILDRSELDAAVGQREALSLLGFHDLDEDGSITREEFAEVFALWAGTVQEVLADTPKKYRKFHLQDMEGDFNIEDLSKKVTSKLLDAARELETQRAMGQTAEL
uniref:Bifunctional lysine-specific demethylase and histidyl-hydroxylase n=1 Tax=Alexandrium catenella TaxID=2925 RepID=A0A7S1LHZ8_ALECA